MFKIYQKYQSDKVTSVECQLILVEHKIKQQYNKVSIKLKIQEIVNFLITHLTISR